MGLRDDPLLVAFAELSGRERDAAFVAVEAERRRLEAVEAAMIDMVACDGSYLDDGYRSAKSWARATLNWSGAEASLRAGIGRTMRELPLLADGVHAGVVGVAQAGELARLWSNPRVRGQLPESEQLLVEQAKLLWHREFVVVCRRWEDLADPDGGHRDHDASRAGRRVTARVDGDGFELRASGDALSGEWVINVLDAYAESMFVQDWDQASAHLGRAPDPCDLERTPGQRRFDALVAIVTAAATAKGRDGAPVPTVNIIVDPDTFEHHLRRFAGDTAAPPPDPATVLSRRCETVSGAVVASRDLIIAAVMGHVRRVVVDSAGRVIDLGRRRRLFTGAAREAVLLMADRCIWPGCDTHHGQVHIDHLQSWTHSRGPTRPDNGAASCQRHNLFKERGYTVHVDNNGHWHHHRPDGSEIAPRPQPGS